MQRLHQLFKVVGGKLHWRIDATHSAPTGVECNVDGTIMRASDILNLIGPKLSTGVDKRPSGQFRARCMISGKRITVGHFGTEADAANALKEANHAA